MKVETEAGTQTRLFGFLGAPAMTLLEPEPRKSRACAGGVGPSWQGTSLGNVGSVLMAERGGSPAESARFRDVNMGT